jgi:hypothetical protein
MLLVSLDRLIRPQQQRRVDREVKGLGALEIDHELELGGLLDGKVGGFRTLEDLVNVGGRTAERGQEYSPRRP